MPRLAIVAPRYDGHCTTGTGVTFRAVKSAGITTPLSNVIWLGDGAPATGVGETFTTSYTNVAFHTVAASLDDTYGQSQMGHFTSQRVCAYRLRLDQVTFGGAGFHAVHRDTGAQDVYAAPHWTPGQSYPVSYRRNTHMNVAAQWSFAPVGAFVGPMQAHATNMWGFNLPAAPATCHKRFAVLVA